MERTITSRECWVVLVTYKIDSETGSEAEEDVREGNPTRSDFEIIERTVEKIIDVEEPQM